MNDRNSPDKCFLDESSLNFLNVSVELPSMTTKQRHIKRNEKNITCKTLQVTKYHKH